MKTLIASALLVSMLAACSSAEKEKQKEAGYMHTEQSLGDAQRAATISCDSAAQCDAVWSLTKTYVQQNSKERLTRADDDAIQTDVPYDSGKAVFSATRVANGAGSGKGGGAIVTLYAQCRGMYEPDRKRGSDYDDCAEKILSTQNGFAAYLRAHLPAR
ncbi:hypothetical protein BVER_01030 [Candidatus Burkholderia verschuerenii]|uniref:Lipoprotein n=1 Tax=Candidatus Burkholderia verschuerenii TaxID=242163 RepID=A0A0L0MEV7_9BURK|nr:hypothetical protein [Candidatus Burkholderia verschuerenii]KND60810.1 hypothetical protein BVER_01030 [Candidatus Burkholderia verschuerenii]